jgi:basic amino acid/polyamine antiporter, APA family
VELATAMPSAGGDYFFVTRSPGPLVGSVSGLLSWFALSSRTAFAIFGLATLISGSTSIGLVPIALALVGAFVVLSLLGAKSAVVFEVMLVAVLAVVVGSLPSSQLAGSVSPLALAVIAVVGRGSRVAGAVLLLGYVALVSTGLAGFG